jgi:hypothetical protein
MGGSETVSGCSESPTVAVAVGESVTVAVAVGQSDTVAGSGELL